MVDCSVIIRVSQSYWSSEEPSLVARRLHRCAAHLRRAWEDGEDLDKVWERESGDAVTFGKVHQVFKNRAMSPLGWSTWAAGAEDKPPRTGRGQVEGSFEGQAKEFEFSLLARGNPLKVIREVMLRAMQGRCGDGRECFGLGDK